MTIAHMTSYRLFICLCCFIFVPKAAAQDNIPPGTWRLHLSYNNIQHVETTGQHVYAAGNSGIMVYNRHDHTVTTYNKLNGLTSTGISSLHYDKANDQLLVGYEDGNLDILKGNTVTSFQRLKDADVTVEKRLNHISSHAGLAYISTAYGVVTFDLQQLEIKETWRDLGTSGERLRIFQTTFLGDSVFLASGNGVLAGNLNDNLLDFKKWTRFNTEMFSGPIEGITTFNNKVYVAGPSGLYRFDGNSWVQEPFLQTESFQSLTASEENLFMIADATIRTMDPSGALSQISDPVIVNPATVKQDNNGNLWIGDQTSGLVSNTGGQFLSYLPDGPSVNTVHKLVYDGGSIYVLSGGFSDSGVPLNNAGELNVFKNGSWSTTLLPIPDLTDIAVVDNKTFIASFGSGVLVTDASGTTFLDETNSPLFHTEPGQSRITALAESPHGLWIANYGGQESLHLLKRDDTWESFAFNFPNAAFPTGLSVDGRGAVWIPLNPQSGGGLIAFDPDERQGYYKGTATGTGALPDPNVYSIATDRDGYVWVGTGAGVVYFFSATEDAMKPIYENRFLLRDEKVTAMAIDGGNRKWIGTEQGVWLFSPTGESLVHRFTAENSPLLSNIIEDIEINPVSGEVFFATDRGIISYRSDATDAGPDFEKIKIFPNPVTPGFSGTVGITGLARDAQVRITDISGKLVWQTRAQGGMASWHVRDHDGNRVSTGVYLVFATAEDGSESVVGKVAVIE